MSLVSLEDAAVQLELPPSITDPSLNDPLLPRLQEALARSEAIIIDYLKKPDHDWTEDTVPGPVSAAIILLLRDLWGDTMGTPAADFIHPDGPIARLLVRHRDPALA